MKNERAHKKLFLSAQAKEFNAEERTIVAIASSGKLDRDREIVRVDGWDLKEFNEHPVILTNHQANDVIRSQIGRALWLKKSKSEGLIFKAQFATTNAAQEAYQLIKDLGIAAFSCGFNVVDSMAVAVKELTDEREYKSAKEVGLEDTDMVRVITKANLFEISLVSLPADQYALMKGSHTAMAEAGAKGLIKSEELQTIYKGLDFSNYVEKEVPELAEETVEETITIAEVPDTTIDIDAIAEAVAAKLREEPVIVIEEDEDQIIEIDVDDIDKSITNIVTSKKGKMVNDMKASIKREIDRLHGKLY